MWALALTRHALNLGSAVKDLYQCLDLTRAASQSEIKKSFRKLTAKYHPDKNPGDKACEERFKEVSQAYDVLSDPDRRKDYDEFGELSLTQGFDRERARAYGGRGRPGGFSGAGFPGGGFQDFGDARNASFDDLISRLFGGAGGSAAPGGGFQRAPRRGADIRGEVQISFRDSLHGTQVPVQISRDNGPPKSVDVRIPAGVADGAKLRLRGQGGAGQPAGDVVLTVRVKPSRLLQRDGFHLRMRLPITALEAYRGGPVDVPTPWGSLSLRIPAGSQSGQTLRLRDKGVQVQGKAKGDLYLTLEVQLPPAGDEELLAALERLQAKSDARANLEVV